MLQLLVLAFDAASLPIQTIIDDMAGDWPADKASLITTPIAAVRKRAASSPRIRSPRSGGQSIGDGQTGRTGALADLLPQEGSAADWENWRRLAPEIYVPLPHDDIGRALVCGSGRGAA